MKHALLAAVVALAPTIGWAQLLPPSPPIQSEPLPPPNMQAPSVQSGAGQAQPMQPPVGRAPGPMPPIVQAPAAPGQGGFTPPATPMPGVVQPPQVPGTTQPFPPPSAETPTTPGEPLPQSGERAAPGQEQGAPGQSAGAPPAPAPPPPNTWLPQGGAIVQVLDKVNAANTTLHVKVGESATYGSLHIQVLGCAIRPPSMARDAAALLVIKDSTPDQPGFQGWMLQNEPFLSMLQSPSYDVRVEGCTP
jgi:hypothetical protein